MFCNPWELEVHARHTMREAELRAAHAVAVRAASSRPTPPARTGLRVGLGRALVVAGLRLGGTLPAPAAVGERPPAVATLLRPIPFGRAGGSRRPAPRPLAIVGSATRSGAPDRSDTRWPAA